MNFARRGVLTVGAIGMLAGAMAGVATDAQPGGSAGEPSVASFPAPAPAAAAAVAGSVTGSAAARLADLRRRRPWLDRRQNADARASELVAAMSLADEVHMLHGVPVDQSPVPTDGYIPPIPSLGVPGITMSDGPLGVRNGQRSTQLPAPVALASSWDTRLARTYGSVLGRDARALGQDQLFAPAMNIDRDARDGRNFEYLSEDPLLSGLMAGAEVKGIQRHGVIATIKHYVANNSETQRGYVSADVSQRALHEIYEKNFGIAVAFGHPDAAMCSYNRINDVYSCSNPDTLGDLRHLYGFNGYVVSDYPATHLTSDLAKGLNVELPLGVHLTLASVRNALAAGTITRGQINRRVYHTVRMFFETGAFDRALSTSPVPQLQDNVVARHVEEQGAVLLRNRNDVLPITAAAHTIAVIGKVARHSAHGSGSSAVLPLSIDNPYQAIMQRAGKGVRVRFNDGTDPSAAATTATGADVALVFVRDYTGEGLDRASLELPDNQDKLIQSVAAANPHTVVVLETGGPVFMPWLNKVSGILAAWYPGARGGKAIARLLFGDVNPSGKLAQTWPMNAVQIPDPLPKEFPGVNREEHYSEGVDVGYRWWVDHGRRPLFPFGYGGSYTTFKYSKPVLSHTTGGPGSRVTFSVRVTNTGKRAGSDIVEAYTDEPDRKVHTPARSLAGFSKVFLRPNTSTTVHFAVGPRNFAYWDDTTDSYAVQAGTYTFYAGGSVGYLPVSSQYHISSGARLAFATQRTFPTPSH